MKEGWEIKKLGEFITEYSVRNKKNLDYPVYSVTNSQGFCRDYFSKEVASQNKTTYKIVPRGYFAYNPSRINVGSVDWQREVDNAIVSPLYVVFGVSESLRQDYLQYYLKSSPIIKLIGAIATGTVRANLKFDTLCSFEISVPSIAEQDKIVAELDCLSGIIEKKKQQLKEYDALAQSIFYEMFGDPVENDKGWDISYLKEIAEFKNGLNFKKVENGRKQLFLGVSNFKDNSIINQIEEYSSIIIADDITEEFLLKDNDIVFVRSNGSKELVGRNIIVYTGNEKITYSGFCIRCRIISSVIIPIFLNYMLSVPSIKQVIKNFGRGANISNLNQTMLGQIKVIVPPLTLQQYYISKIEAIEKQKTLIKKSIEEVETLFNSRMDYYFN